MTTTSEEVWQLLRELIEAQKETRLILEKQAEEAEKSRQEYQKRFAETERILKEQ